MKNSAGRSVIFSLVMLFVTLFYIQPTVGEAFDLATGVNTNETGQDQNLISTNLLESTENTTNNSETKVSLTDKSSKSGMFKATAYCLKGRTANGGGVRRGIVAADPRVLPLGTRIQITAGAYSGIYTVADTGGAVRGRILDVWVPNCSEAMRFGRRNISVSVLARK